MSSIVLILAITFTLVCVASFRLLYIKCRMEKNAKYLSSQRIDPYYRAAIRQGTLMRKDRRGML